MTRQIFDYPSDWEIFDLSPSEKNDIILDVSQGTTPSTKNPDYWNGTIPWISITDITHRFTPIYISTHERFLTKKGSTKCGKIYKANTVMLSSTGSVGFVVINKIPMATNQGFLNFECGSKLLPEFLYFWFKANKPYLDRVANASTFDSLYKYDLFEFKIGIPKIKEQQKIVNVLNSLDKKIQNNLKIKQILISSLFTIYKNWFVNNEENNSKAWKKVTFNELATTQRGLSYKGYEKSNDNTVNAFITLKNISANGGFNTVYSWINSSRLKERHFVKELDLVIANTHFGIGGSDTARLLANPALIIFPAFYSKPNAVFSHHVSKVLLKKNNIKYFLYFLFFDKHIEIASKYHTGTGVIGFDYKNFEEEYEVTLPPIPLLEEFEKICTSAFQQVLNLEKQIMILEKSRDLLQRRLVYGKTRLE